MAPDWIERLLANPDAPIDTVMRVVRGKGLNVVISALFDEGARVQHRDPERALACVRLINRIQAHTKTWKP